MLRYRGVKRLLLLSALIVQGPEMRLAADVAHDGTFSSGVLTGPHYQILETQGARPGGGANLFFSFQRFSLLSSESATFIGSAGIQNILARVTGGTASSIDGAIICTVPGANLFLINPAGVMFGPNASLDVSGSFYSATADYVTLQDGGRFSATPGSHDVSLTAAPPEAFGFSSPAPAGIAVDGSILSVPAGKNLSLVGGPVFIGNGAYLEAIDGAVQIAGAAAAGEITLDGMGAVPGFQSTAADHADVTIANSVVDAHGDQGGSVFIRGGRIEIHNSALDATTWANGPGRGVDIEGQDDVVLGDGNFITADNRGTGRSGDIKITAGRNLVLGESPSTFFSLSAVNYAGGELGDISIHAAQDVTVGPNAQVLTEGAGSGGEMGFQAGGEILLGAGSRIEAINQGGVFGSRLEVTAGGRLTVLPGAFLRTLSNGSGRSGDMVVTAGSISIQGGGVPTGILSDTSAGVAGSAGDVAVSSPGLIAITDSGVIAAATHGQGAGGRLSVSAGSLSIDGTNQGATLTGIQAVTDAQTVDAGAAGILNVAVTGQVTLTNGGIITSDTRGPGSGGSVNVSAGSIFADRAQSSLTGITALSTRETPGGGNAGNIAVTVLNDLVVRNGALIDTSTFGSGNAGSVLVSAGSILIDRMGSDFFTGIGSDSAPAAGQPGGHAGSVDVSSGSISIRAGGNISTSTFGSGNAGSVDVATGVLDIAGAGTDNSTVPLPNSGIVAVAKLGSTGNAGSVTVTATNLTLTDRAIVAALTQGSGNAGSVFVTADQAVMTGNAQISSLSTGLGEAGGIGISLRDTLRMSGGSVISVESLLTNAGGAAVTAGGSILLTDSAIRTSAGIDGGSITLAARNFISLDRSRLTAEAQNDGGNIFLRAARFALLNHSVLTANAVNGRGGFIQVGTDVLLANNSRITASSQFGADGKVRIDANFDLSSTAKELDDDLLDASDQLQPRCTAKIPGETGSFILMGKGGLPVMPGRFLPAHLLMDLPEE